MQRWEEEEDKVVFRETRVKLLHQVTLSLGHKKVSTEDGVLSGCTPTATEPTLPFSRG